MDIWKKKKLSLFIVKSQVFSTRYSYCSARSTLVFRPLHVRLFPSRFFIGCGSKPRSPKSRCSIQRSYFSAFLKRAVHKQRYTKFALSIVALHQISALSKLRMDKNALYQNSAWTKTRSTKLAYGQICAVPNWRMDKYALG